MSNSYLTDAQLRRQRSDEMNRRYAQRMAEGTWDHTEGHPVFLQAKQQVLTYLQHACRKKGEATVYDLRHFIESDFERKGSKLFHMVVMALEREGKIELIYRQPPASLIDMNPKHWFFPKDGRTTANGFPSSFNFIVVKE